jgi:hypothetical protein
LPQGFDGLIWTDDIRVIGPIVHNGSSTTRRNEPLQIRYANAFYWPI